LCTLPVELGEKEGEGRDPLKKKGKREGGGGGGPQSFNSAAGKREKQVITILPFAGHRKEKKPKKGNVHAGKRKRKGGKKEGKKTCHQSERNEGRKKKRGKRQFLPTVIKKKGRRGRGGASILPARRTEAARKERGKDTHHWEKEPQTLPNPKGGKRNGESSIFFSEKMGREGKGKEALPYNCRKKRDGLLTLLTAMGKGKKKRRVVASLPQKKRKGRDFSIKSAHGGMGDLPAAEGDRADYLLSKRKRSWPIDAYPGGKGKETRRSFPIHGRKKRKKRRPPCVYPSCIAVPRRMEKRYSLLYQRRKRGNTDIFLKPGLEKRKARVANTSLLCGKGKKRENKKKEWRPLFLAGQNSKKKK